jgi:hypothetical protein
MTISKRESSQASVEWKYLASGISSSGAGVTISQTKVSMLNTYRSETMRRSVTRRPPYHTKGLSKVEPRDNRRRTKRYIFEPTTVVDAPFEKRQTTELQNYRGWGKLTTSFGGITPVVFRQNVVKSDIECIVRN